MKQFRRLYRYLLPYTRQMIIISICLIVWSGVNLALPLAIRYLVDTVFISHDLGVLNRISLGLLALFISQAVIGYYQVYLIIFVGQRVVANLRLLIHDHLVDLPLRFYAESRVGELVSRVTNDVTVIQNSLVEVPTNLLRQVVTIAGGLTLMLLMNWKLTLMMLLLVPALIAVATFFGRKLERLSTKVQDLLADATAVLEEALSGIRVVKSFTQENYERGRFQKRIEATFDMTMERTRLRAAFVPIISFLSFVALIAILWVGGRQVIAGVSTPGELVAFLIYMVMVGGPMGELAGMYSQVREALGATRRIFDILDTAVEPYTEAGAVPLPPVEGRVRFVDVSFGYESQENVLKHIDLDVQPGQVIALVGPSGVGKTSLVNLIPRFFDPTSGRIEVDGYDLCKVELHSLRQQIGLVPQETFLFGGTVQENIAYGSPTSNLEQIIAAASAAYADEFIQAMPQGYETIVGERGAKLSAGQRQRIAIARALLKDPRILILDEATSALDTESEKSVQAALDRLMQGRTTFVIAHRLSTIQRADLILVLHEGRIEEQGTHAQLLARGGLYHRLWSLQFAEPENFRA